MRWAGEDGIGLLSDQGRLRRIVDNQIKRFDPDVVIVAVMVSYLDRNKTRPFRRRTGPTRGRRQRGDVPPMAGKAQDLIASARRRGALVLWALAPPIKPGSWFGYLSGRVDRLNSIYRDLDGVTLVDWNSFAAAKSASSPSRCRTAPGR